jgi:hypothetical protein
MRFFVRLKPEDVVHRPLPDAARLLRGHQKTCAHSHRRRRSVEHGRRCRRGTAGHDARAVLGDVRDRDGLGIRAHCDLDMVGGDADTLYPVVSVLRAAHGEGTLGREPHGGELAGHAED